MFSELQKNILFCAIGLKVAEQDLLILLKSCLKSLQRFKHRISRCKMAGAGFHSIDKNPRSNSAICHYSANTLSSRSQMHCGLPNPAMGGHQQICICRILQQIYAVYYPLLLFSSIYYSLHKFTTMYTEYLRTGKFPVYFVYEKIH
jgi:hypothetical protein